VSMKRDKLKIKKRWWERRNDEKERHINKLEKKLERKKGENLNPC
jgi:hypothetical protein